MSVDFPTPSEPRTAISSPVGCVRRRMHRRASENTYAITANGFRAKLVFHVCARVCVSNVSRFRLTQASTTRRFICPRKICRASCSAFDRPSCSTKPLSRLACAGDAARFHTFFARRYRNSASGAGIQKRPCLLLPEMSDCTEGTFRPPLRCSMIMSMAAECTVVPSNQTKTK